MKQPGAFQYVLHRIRKKHVIGVKAEQISTRSRSTSRDVVIDSFAAVRRHTRGGVLAPNKPLTLLWAVDRVERGEPRLTRFVEAEAELRPLLDAYGTRGTAASYAFWRLQNDGLWEVTSSGLLPPRSGEKEPKLTALRADARGGFKCRVYEELLADPSLRRDVTCLLLDQLDGARGPRAWSPPAHMGRETVRRLVREAAFRREVMAAFGPRCVVCGWGLVHQGRPVALIAAHVRPFGEGGPDGPGNGMPLCSLHHDLFDTGVFAYDASRRLIVAESVVGQDAGGPWQLLDHAGEPLPEPRDTGWRVADAYLSWHRRHVFAGVAADRAFSRGT